MLSFLHIFVAEINNYEDKNLNRFQIPTADSYPELETAIG